MKPGTDNGPSRLGHLTRLRRWAMVSYVLSVLTIAASTVFAASRYPDGFDWVYTVMSALASRKHNPEGGAWFALGLALSLALLWLPVARIHRGIKLHDRIGRIGARALRLGIALGVLVGIERLLFFHVSQNAHKAHEILALLCFLSLYLGVCLIQAGRIRHHSGPRWPAWLVIAPLLGIGFNQLALYLDQRDLGWVDVGWRGLGVPFWMSFAFWQWLAAAVLWFGIGQLTATAKASA